MRATGVLVGSDAAWHTLGPCSLIPWSAEHRYFWGSSGPQNQTTTSCWRCIVLSSVADTLLHLKRDIGIDVIQAHAAPSNLLHHFSVSENSYHESPRQLVPRRWGQVLSTMSDIGEHTHMHIYTHTLYMTWQDTWYSKRTHTRAHTHTHIVYDIGRVHGIVNVTQIMVYSPSLEQHCY